MLKTLRLTLPLSLPLAVFTGSILFFSMAAQAQDDNKAAATAECNKVLQKSAAKAEKDYDNRACESNMYPTDFWQCVNREVDSFELNMAIYFCEKSYGFK